MKPTLKPAEFCNSVPKYYPQDSSWRGGIFFVSKTKGIYISLKVLFIVYQLF
jgi:hypothetical protein